jgi:hypothetical protein
VALWLGVLWLGEARVRKPLSKPVAVSIDRFIVDVTRKGRLKGRATRNGTRLFIGYNKRALWVFEKVDILGNFD